MTLHDLGLQMKNHLNETIFVVTNVWKWLTLFDHYLLLLNSLTVRIHLVQHVLSITCFYHVFCIIFYSVLVVNRSGIYRLHWAVYKYQARSMLECTPLNSFCRISIFPCNEKMLIRQKELNNLRSLLTLYDFFWFI